MSDETEAEAVVLEVIGGETRMMVGEGGAMFEVNWPPAEWLAEKIARNEVQILEPESEAKPAKKAAGKK